MIDADIFDGDYVVVRQQPIAENVRRLIRARIGNRVEERSEIDWDTANRLTKENTDFLEYIKLIRQFYQTGEIRQSDWDMSADQD